MYSMGLQRADTGWATNKSYETEFVFHRKEKFYNCSKKKKKKKLSFEVVPGSASQHGRHPSEH